MAENISMSMKIPVELQDDKLVKQLESLMSGIGKGVVDMVSDSLKTAESVIPDSKSSSTNSGGKSGGLGNMLGGAMKMLKSGLSFLKTVSLSLIAVVGAVSLFSPVMEMLSQIGGFLKTFLKPISEAFMFLIVPIFAMMRPILQAMNAFMMPFRKIAIQGMAAANSLVAQGMKEKLEGNDEAGNTLITKGMKGSLDTAGLMFSGFTDFLISPIADMLGLGEQFATAMTKWQSAAAEGVTETVLFANSFRILKDSYDTIDEAITKSESIVSQKMKNISELFGEGFDIVELEKIWNTVRKETQDGVKLVAAVLTGDDDSIISATDDFIKAAKEAKEPLAEYAAGIREVNDALLALDLSSRDALMAQERKTLIKTVTTSDVTTGDRFKAMIKGFFNFEDRSLLESINPVMSIIASFKSSKAELAKLYTDENAAKLKEVRIFQDRWSEEISKAALKDYNSRKSGLEHENTLMTNYYGNSIIPDNFEKGLEHMNTIVTEQMKILGTNTSASFSDDGAAGDTKTTNINVMDSSFDTINATASKQMELFNATVSDNFVDMTSNVGDTTLKAMSILNTNTKDGFLNMTDNMNIITTKALGTEGTVVTSYKNGMTNMIDSSKNFATGMNEVADIAKDAAKRVESWAGKYYSALNRIERMKRSSKTGRA